VNIKGYDFLWSSLHCVLKKELLGVMGSWILIPDKIQS